MRLYYSILILITSLLTTHFAQAAVLNFGITDSLPYSSVDGSGIADRIIKEALRREGIDAKFTIMPSERSLTNANEGIIDGEYIRIEGLQNTYTNLIMVPESVCNYDFTAFSRDPGIKINGWKSLAPYNVAFITGWKILEKNVEFSKSLTKVKNAQILFDLLANDRVDIVLIEKEQGELLIKQQRLQNMHALQPPLATRKMYLYLNKKHSALAPGIAQQLLKMKRDGSIARITAEVLGKAR